MELTAGGQGVFPTNNVSLPFLRIISFEPPKKPPFGFAAVAPNANDHPRFETLQLQRFEMILQNAKRLTFSSQNA
jgi:hypothetical protein